MTLISLCEYCGLDMVQHVSCTVPTLIIDDTIYDRVVFGSEEIHHPDAKFAYCPDCAAPPSGLHHFMCDWEQCPCCGEQLLGCECKVDPPKQVVWHYDKSQMTLAFE